MLGTPTQRSSANHNDGGTSQRTVKSGLWAVSGKVMARAVDLFTILILARALTPADFGLVAIALSVILITEALLELPINAVLIVSRELTEEVFATAFTLGLIRALLVGCLSCIAGAFLADIHGDQKLFWLTAALSLAPALRGLVSPLIMVRAQNFDFRPQFFMEVGGKFAAFAVSTSFAILTSSYWAIVLGTIIAPAVMVIISYWISPYRPKLSLKRWRMFSSFIGWTAATQLLSAVSWQLERLILPRYISVPDFGRYVTASEVAALPAKAIVQPLVMPLLAGFSEVQRYSGERLSDAYLRASESLATIILPILAIIIAFPSELTAILLGPKWEGASLIISWLCLISILSVPRSFTTPLLFTTGNVGVVAALILVELSTKLPPLLYLVPSMGINGALIAQAISGSFALVASCFALQKFCRVSIIGQMRSFFRPAAAALIMYFIMTSSKSVSFGSYSNDFNFLAAIPLATLLYIGLIGFFWFASGKPSGSVTSAVDLYMKMRRR